ncbi:PI31 proteasome regulator N-terminal-domain-containing protein [Entophlyctis helioformis]|nr:PI31 proteasome regulator N-terminal-domain-containing protein [Entophlyctis helioformis]
MADANPLAPLALLATLGRVLALFYVDALLRPSAAHDAPLLASPADLAVATCHAALTALGFRFLGIGEDTPRSAPAASHASNTNTNSDSTDDSSDAARLPPAWNATGDTYSLRYAHPQSSFTFLLKAVRLASKLILHAMSIQAAVVHDLALDVSSLADASSFPIRRSSLAAASTNASNASTNTFTRSSTNTSTDAADWWAPHPLGRAFLSKDRLEEFVYQFKTRIVQQLIPGLNKPGYEESRPLPSATASTAAPTPAHPQPSGSLRDPARGGRAPDWEPSGVPFPGQGGGGGRASGAPFAPSPYGVGDVDLDPFAAAPGLILPGRGGMYPGGGGGHASRRRHVCRPRSPHVWWPWRWWPVCAANGRAAAVAPRRRAARCTL